MTNIPMGSATYEFKVGNFDKEAKQTKDKTKNLAGKMESCFTKSFKAVSKNLIKIGATMTAVGGVGLKFIGDSIKLAGKQGKAVEKVFSVYQATEGVVGRTFEELKKQASELQSKTIFGDEDILENLTAPLLTFKSIQGDVFDRTQALALDLSATFGQDLKGSAIQLGKAIEDPVKGMSALNRVGVTFSEEQKKQIENYQAQGKLVEAQTVLLDTLAGQVEGVAEGMALSFEGQIIQTQNAFGDLREAIGEVFTQNPEVLGFITQIRIKIEEATEYIKANPEIVVTFTKIAGAITAIGAVVGVLGGLGLALSGLSVFLSPAGLIALGITALVAGIGYVVTNRETLRVPLELGIQSLQIKFQAFKDGVSQARQFLVADIGIAIQGIQLRFFNLKASISNTRQSITARVGLAVQSLQIRWFNLVQGVVNMRNGVVTAISGLAGTIGGVFRRAGGFVQGLINKFGSLKTKVASVIKSVKDKVASFSLGGILGLAGNRETGGPVGGGSAYIVGEKGPELFVPNSNGFVLPTPVTNSVLNNQKNFTVNVSDNGSDDPFRFGRQIGVGLSSSGL